MSGQLSNQRKEILAKAAILGLLLCSFGVAVCWKLWGLKVSWLWVWLIGYGIFYGLCWMIVKVYDWRREREWKAVKGILDELGTTVPESSIRVFKIGPSVDLVDKASYRVSISDSVVVEARIPASVFETLSESEIEKRIKEWFGLRPLPRTNTVVEIPAAEILT